MKPEKPSWFKNFFGGMISLLIRTLILFALLEVTLRMFGVKPHIAFVNAEGPFMVHNIRKWTMKPNFNGEWSGVKFQTNSLGFRDDEIVMPKPAHEFRILTIGGSITTGYGVEHSQGYVEQLQELLQRTQVRAVKVINAGIPGYAPFQYVHLLKETGLALDPDLILLDFSINDVLDKQANLKELGGKGEFRGGGAFLRFDPEQDDIKHIKQLMQDLPKHSSLYTAARWLQIKYFSKYLAKRESNQEFEQLKLLMEPSTNPAIAAAWADTKKDVQRMIHMAKEKNIPVVILMFPMKMQVDYPQGHDHPQEIMAQFSKENQLLLIDLLPVFRDKTAKDGSSQQLCQDNDHPTVTGHNLAAVALHRELTSYLKEKTILSTPTPLPTATDETH